MPPTPILEPKDIPTDVIVDTEQLRAVLPHRFEMAQITAVTLLDGERKLVAGYKDVRSDEFWVRGHMPGYPLLPGVLMCESAAQLSGVYCHHFDLSVGDFLGFGGMDKVRFRGIVRPGDRLWIVGRTDRHSTRRMTFEMQGFVGKSMVFHGEFIGLPLFHEKPGG